MRNAQNERAGYVSLRSVGTSYDQYSFRIEFELGSSLLNCGRSQIDARPIRYGRLEAPLCIAMHNTSLVQLSRGSLTDCARHRWIGKAIPRCSATSNKIV